ncbi:MAG: hypothetical protein R3C05_30170 [Pirellulaceae bacterium]
MNDIEQAYNRLGVPRDASLPQIEAAFQSLRSKFQADPGADPWDFQTIEEAYQLARGDRLASRHADILSVPAQPVGCET